jgi:hypothetical protein
MATDDDDRCDAERAETGGTTWSALDGATAARPSNTSPTESLGTSTRIEILATAR